jgi:hypothetical protein
MDESISFSFDEPNGIATPLFSHSPRHAVLNTVKGEIH